MAASSGAVAAVDGARYVRLPDFFSGVCREYDVYDAFLEVCVPLIRVLSVCAGLPAMVTVQLWQHVVTRSCAIGVPWGLCRFAASMCVSTVTSHTTAGCPALV